MPVGTNSAFMLAGTREEDGMKIAIPMFTNRVSPRFDFASKVLIAAVADRQVLERQEFSLIHLNPIRRNSLLCELGVNVLICGGISTFTRRLAVGNGIDVIPMVQGEIEEVLNLFMGGDLSSAIIPISSGKGYRHQGKRKAGCGRKSKKLFHHKR
jgi:predicted Fe-Mo cluster-binding NifX family protein